MTTQEIVKKFVDYCNAGNFEAIYTELYSPDVLSVEADGSTVKGIDGIHQKGKEFHAKIKSMSNSSMSDPIISANAFAVTMKMDAEYTDGSKHTLDEVCVYEIRDGKIVKEQFFF